MMMMMMMIMMMITTTIIITITIIIIIIICNYVTNKTTEQRVLHEKLTVPQIVKKLPALYGTCWFVTAFTKSCHLFLS
jgi:hypothetical protein